MTCAECKYQWCWLCEGEYQEGHFRRGTCEGLQFAKIDHLEEKEYLVSQENKMTRDKLRKRQKEKGFFLFNKEIKNKFEYCGQRSIFRLYYGNQCIEFLFCLIIILFFTIPYFSFFMFYQIYERRDSHVRTYMHYQLGLIGIMLFICYHFLATQLVFLTLFVTFFIPPVNCIRVFNIKSR